MPAAFEWDPAKAAENLRKHGVSFAEAQRVFLDPRRVIARDDAHSDAEPRHYCIGRVADRVLAVRFTWRGDVVRLIGAGHWRKGRRLYEALEKARG